MTRTGLFSPVSPFVLAIARGTTPERRTGPHCQQGTPPDFRPVLLRPHSQSAAFEPPGRPSRAPVATPAAADLPALAVTVIGQVTSLSELPEDSRPYVPGSRPGIVSMQQTLVISGGRTWKRPLTHRPQAFAARHVSCPTYRQALAGLSWLSYSSPRDLPAVAGPVKARSRLSPGRELPTPAGLCEVSRPLTPRAGFEPEGSHPLRRRRLRSHPTPKSVRIAHTPGPQRGRAGIG